jgi:hypothetical protein
MKRIFHRLLPLWIFAFAWLGALPAGAVSTSHWTQQNEADFKPGTFHNVVATNLGDLKLSRAVHKLLDQDPKISAVYALAEATDGTVYAGTGPQGVLLAIKGDTVTTAATLADETNIFSILAQPDGSVLIGTGGSRGRIYRLDKPAGKATGKPSDKPATEPVKPRIIFEADGVQYIWAMVAAPDGTLYAATGPTGQLYEIKPDGSHSVILATKENNLLSMIAGRGQNADILYVGTDPNGLVYRVNRKTHESFVVYDANESEISALATDEKGNLYVATAEASDQTTSTADEASGDKVGHPEGSAGGVPIGSSPAPGSPAPAPPPSPNPGEPPPLPQKSGVAKPVKPTPAISAHTQKLMLLAAGADADAADQDAGADPTPPPGKNPSPAATTSPAPPQQSINANGTGEPTEGGNAVYKIDPNGFVSEVFRQPVLVFAIAEHDGVLLVATGSDGLVYQVNPAAEETVVVAKVDPKQVTALLPTHDGRILLGLSNVGGLAVMGAGYADTGTYTSAVADATQISQFGKIGLHGLLPAKTTLTVSSRSGNVKEPADSSWSPWAPEQPAAQFVQSASPAARFFQYRLTFATADAGVSPVVEDVDTAYLMPNLAPIVKEIKITLGSKSAPPPPQPGPDQEPAAAAILATPPGRIQTISWDASDPNDDPLRYTLYYRSLTQDGPWLLLKDKLKDTTYEWDTRTVADGRYEVKVVASDAAANPIGQGKTASRVSDPMLIDNSSPTLDSLKTTQAADGVHVDVRAQAPTATIAAVDFCIDGNQDWQAASPADKMFDGPSAPATFTVTGLSPGEHQLTIRATDTRGNEGYVSVVVRIASPTGAAAITQPVPAGAAPR